MVSRVERRMTCSLPCCDSLSPTVVAEDPEGFDWPSRRFRRHLTKKTRRELREAGWIELTHDWRPVPERPGDETPMTRLWVCPACWEVLTWWREASQNARAREPVDVPRWADGSEAGPPAEWLLLLDATDGAAGEVVDRAQTSVVRPAAHLTTGSHRRIPLADVVRTDVLRRRRLRRLRAQRLGVDADVDP